MNMELIIHCEKCGKLLQGKAEKARTFGECPRCGHKLAIPVPAMHENRKHKRAVVVESKFVKPIWETLTQSKEPSLYRIVYTEAPPVEFALNRASDSPLLDISEGGMGILVKADAKSNGLLPGNIFVAEIDFPILIQPIFIRVEVCWMRPLKEDRLFHIGVRFCESGEYLEDLLKNLVRYVESKSKAIDIDKWGSFG